jgi:hypothetical protein
MFYSGFTGQFQVRKRVGVNGASFVLVEDAATAAGGLFNAGYFAGYWFRARETRARRIGAAALVVAGLAAAVEALFSQGMLRFHDELLALGDLSGGLWVLARLPLLLATAFITGIVLRRIFS